MTLELIDTHAHLDDERFRADLPEVLDRAHAAGVRRILTIATTGADSAGCVALAERYPQLAATVGLQPNNLAREPANAWDDVLRLANNPVVVGIGETGLDRHWDDTPFAVQEDYFARHLALARQRQLAVVIHCREAEADVLRMLRDDYERHGPVRGVMHSFTADEATAAQCLAMGLYISFAGMVTYKNAQALREAAKTIPLDRLLVETDSPYLAPVPLRGKRNEPAFVEHTARCLATARGENAALLAAAASRNAHILFRLT